MTGTYQPNREEALVAPNNVYLAAHDDVRERLTARGLVKRTTYESGEDFSAEPDVHVDFNKAAEAALLEAFLEPFAEPDFADGKVTLDAAAMAVYGPEPDEEEYLLNRVGTTMLRSWSAFNTAFNKKHPSNGGLVFVATRDGTIVRGDRVKLAEQTQADESADADRLFEKQALLRLRKQRTAQNRADKIDPNHKADHVVTFGENMQQMMQRAVLAITGGGNESDA